VTPGAAAGEATIPVVTRPLPSAPVFPVDARGKHGRPHDGPDRGAAQSAAANASFLAPRRAAGSRGPQSSPFQTNA
jgi:hypothetical protein